MKPHIGIVCSYKFEDLNVLLEILKLNFKRECHITVQCNLNNDLFQKIKNVIEFDLIDNFIHKPEPLCVPSNTDRDTKRRQPLEMFEEITRTLSPDHHSIFLEGDFFPFREDLFYGQLERLDTCDVIANRFDFSDDTSNFSSENKMAVADALSHMHKMPKGYIHPSLMYFSKGVPSRLSNYIKQAKSQLLDGKKNFEGCLGVIYDALKLNRVDYGRNFCLTYPDFKVIDPVLHVTHQHNILNMQDAFFKYKIENGIWVNYVRNGTCFSRAVDGHFFKRNINTLTYSDLELQNG